MEFEGKVILVAGASSGMGRQLAVRLAQLGAYVLVTARRQALLEALVNEITQAGGRCKAYMADAMDAQAAAHVVSDCIAHAGRIDMVVLNAGGAPAIDMRRMQASEVTAYMRSNYDVAVNFLFPILQHMVKQGGGVVAHTNSLAGFLGIPLQGPYSAAKGALRLLIDTCRLEYGPFGIQFVSLYPGFVATQATASDGMPAPLELSEQVAVEHMLRALHRRPMDYLFPFSMRWLVRLALLLPKGLVMRVLRSEVPTLTRDQVLAGYKP